MQSPGTNKRTRRRKAGGDSQNKRSVVVLVETTKAYSRGCCAGSSDSTGNATAGPSIIDPTAWEECRPGGGRVGGTATAFWHALLTSGSPTRCSGPACRWIDLQGSLRDLAVPFVGSDEGAAALNVFEHLQERGLRQFGFYGLRPGIHLADDIYRESFQQIVESAGCRCSVFLSRRGPHSKDWRQEQQETGRGSSPLRNQSAWWRRTTITDSKCSTCAGLSKCRCLMRSP